MLYTFNEVHLPFYLFPGYPDYNDPELANVFKAAIPHVVELLAAFTAQLWLIPTQALLPRTTTVDIGNCSQQSQGSDELPRLNDVERKDFARWAWAWVRRGLRQACLDEAQVPWLGCGLPKPACAPIQRLRQWLQNTACGSGGGMACAARLVTMQNGFSMSKVPFLNNKRLGKPLCGLEEARMMYTMGGKECTLMVRKVDKRRCIGDDQTLVVIGEGEEVTGKSYQ
ncbi:hypothetical protein B0H13DRAFT_1862810 [Mycena leptocephala]|nr:hypothetical protein B0H13DRAFT_1862810 [Mycena leptocephala]